MAYITPWMDSTKMIEAIKRKILFPVSQDTFTDEQILAFVNEETFVSQVPSIMEYHQEYFVYSLSVPLKTNQKAYQIPNRAIAMKLRAVFLADNNGNLYEMSRVQSEDRTFFQSGNGSVNTIYTYYLQGNDLVLTSDLTPVPPSNLVFLFLLRPNQLVPVERAATCESFSNTITLDTVSAGDTITFTTTDYFTAVVTTTTFEAVSGFPATSLEFQIGGSNILTATNLCNAITTSGIATASNANSTSNIVTAVFPLIQTQIATSNDSGIIIPQTTLTINFDQVPTSLVTSLGETVTVFENGALVDFLQTQPGHKTYVYDIPIPTNGISGDSITFNVSDLPDNFIVGDYICLANECIIPQIPPDLHNGLAERASARILAALGDQQGLQASMQKIQDIDRRQGMLLDNRVEGNPIKVTNRHSILAYQKMNYRRLM